MQQPPNQIMFASKDVVFNIPTGEINEGEL